MLRHIVEACTKRDCLPIDRRAVYAVLGPVVHAALALAFARVAGVDVEDAALLTVLAASASSIAVVRHAVPEARPAV